jgi:arsenite-transporting ATPase
MIEKIIVLGGKGGVGKSSISAATALLLSKLLPEKNILLISFDMAHNLTDMLNTQIGNKLTSLKDNLWAIEPDPDEYAEKYIGNLVDKMKQLMKQMPLIGMIKGIETHIDETFTPDSIPLALKNAMFFQRILDSEGNDGQRKFDIIVADFPPTANMVTLFEIPEDQAKVALKYSLNFYNSVKGAMEKFSKVIRRMIKPFDNGQYEQRRELGKEIYDMVIELEKRGERITELIHKVGSLRLVSIAEKPSFEEIKRARDLTQKYVQLDAVHINMLIPRKHAEKCDFCHQISNTQQKYTSEIKKEFNHLKVWESNRLKHEPLGIDGLMKLAKAVYYESSAKEILDPC